MKTYKIKDCTANPLSMISFFSSCELHTHTLVFRCYANSIECYPSVFILHFPFCHTDFQLIVFHAGVDGK